MNPLRKYIGIGAIFAILIIPWGFHGFSQEQTEREGADWKLKKDKNDIRVYTRQEEGTKFKAFKANTVINAPVEWVFEMLMDVPRKPNWMADLENAELLDSLNPYEQVEYYRSGVPGPFRDRDIILNAKVLERTRDKTVIRYESRPDFLPEKDKIIRIRLAKGEWILTAVGEQQAHVEYGMLLDPGGQLPAWIVNLFIVDGPFQTLTNLQELSSLRKQF